MGDVITSAIRTGVPIVVGWVVFWLNDRFGLEIDTEAVAVPVAGAIMWGYYLIARRLEQRDARFGWLLGKPTAPTYDA